ncbi:MAG: DUF2378 family protein [Myxococcales bacterium]|nr:DUF2378 family protein [Myxococcales bacterium]MCB9626008.1 DUF2378 family protein [Sandaracinaceae bacterium]
MDHPYDFRVPDFSGDLDPGPYLSATPETATVKGLYFQTMLDMMAALPKERVADVVVERPRYLPFFDYPLREHMRLSFALVPRLFPGVPTRQAFREMGWKAFPDFAGTMLGRVVFGVFGDDLEKAFEGGPRAVSQSVKPGMAAVTLLAERHARMEYYDIYGILDPYYIGVVEGMVRHYGFEPDVRIHAIDIANAVLDIRW